MKTFSLELQAEMKMEMRAKKTDFIIKIVFLIRIESPSWERSFEASPISDWIYPSHFTLILC